MKKAYFLFVFVLSALVSSGQSNFCAFDQYKSQLQSKVPGLLQQDQTFNHSIYQRIKQGPPISGLRQIYTIPTVVHIIHNNGAANISDAQVQAAIGHLNDAFANIGYYDPGTGVSVDIQFCMAEQDPQGMPTNGITRTVSTLTSMSISEDAQMKGLIQWDPLSYFNVWVVGDIQGGIAGYATFPTSHGGPLDGIVLEDDYMGTSNANSAVLVHETGHYFGLYHPFQNECGNNDCLLDGDQVCDTPPDQSTSWVACNSAPNSCLTDEDDASVNNPFRSVANGGIGDQTDQISNYMDYSDFICYNQFTQGQEDRMLITVTTTRASLLSSIGCQSPCPHTITASFNSSQTSVPTGTTVNFTNLSSGANAYTWSINGASFSTSTNTSHLFNNPGVYFVSLVAVDANISGCISYYQDTVYVYCAVQPDFTASDNLIPTDSSVFFTNNTIGAQSFEWIINGSTVSTAQNLNYTFTQNGVYSVCLVSYDGNCRDTLCELVKVGMSCEYKRANWWYFGLNAGFDFTGGFPTVITNGQLSTNEAVATMSSTSGDLLFYTDGIQVWDASHSTMPNGLGLHGDISSTQCAISPWPGNPDRYFIFTTNSPAGASSSGFCYSEVDMSLNGGFGDVVTATKNTQLISYSNSTEKICLVKHCNEVDYWAITQKWGSNTYNAYLIDANGINTNPVVSQVGTATPGTHTQERIGAMKASQDGRRIGVANVNLECFEVFDFNRNTGQMTNPIKLTDPEFYGAYGIEFSADGDLLYASRVHGGAAVYQFDLTAGSTNDILNSKVTLESNVNDYRYAGLQMGPDGRIYVAKRQQWASPSGFDYIAVIEFPDIKGTACGFNDNYFNLNPAQSTSGLPNIFTGFYDEDAPKIEGFDTVCSPLTTLSLQDTICIDAVVWSVNGDVSIVASNDTNVTIQFNDYGSATVFANKINSCGNAKMDSFNVVYPEMPAPLDLGPDWEICENTLITLDAIGQYKTYSWSTGETSSSITFSEGGTYSLTVTDSCGNEHIDEVIVKIKSPTIDLFNDMLFCEGKDTTLEASGFLSYLWYDGFTTPDHFFDEAGQYWIQLVDPEGCVAIDSFELEYEFCGENTYYIPSAFSPNDDGFNDQLFIRGTSIEKVLFRIYDRWGRLVFETIDPDQAWDGRFKGKDCQTAVYFYMAEIVFSDDSKLRLKGNITLLK